MDLSADQVCCDCCRDNRAHLRDVDFDVGDGGTLDRLGCFRGGALNENDALIRQTCGPLYHLLGHGFWGNDENGLDGVGLLAQI